MIMAGWEHPTMRALGRKIDYGHLWQYYALDLVDLRKSVSRYGVSNISDSVKIDRGINDADSSSYRLNSY